MALYDQLLAASKPLTTKEEVIDYYRETFPGRETWKSRLADKLAPIAGVKRDTIMRRFQKGRTGDARSKAETERQYRELGLQLPPKPPDDGFQLKGKIFVQFSKTCEERELDGVNMPAITGQGAKALLDQEQDPYQIIVNVYMEDAFFEPEGYQPCNVGGWDVTVV